MRFWRVGWRGIESLNFRLKYAAKIDVAALGIELLGVVGKEAIVSGDLVRQEWNNSILTLRAADSVIDGIGDAFVSACEEIAPMLYTGMGSAPGVGAGGGSRGNVEGMLMR